MLVDFSFGNFKCYKGEQQFSMRRDGQSGYLPFNDISTVTAIYGANASGKSSLLDAIQFAATFAVRSYGEGSSGDRIAGRIPFLLDRSSWEKPSTFYFELITPSLVRYKYWFSINDTQVLTENLIVYRSSRPSLLFSRDMGSEGKYTNSHGQSIDFGPSFIGSKKQLWDITRENSLFLSSAAAGGNKIIEPVFSELKKISLYVARYYESEILQIRQLLREDSREKSTLQQLIKFADLGISDIELKTPQDRSEQESKSPATEEESSDNYIDARNREDSAEIVFVHSGNNLEAVFPAEYESAGTVGALSFFSMAMRAIKFGGIALVDEIDSSLHPTLVKELVRLFAEKETNPNNAQLIFTTHDVSLIDVGSSGDRVLERDQIWFVEKTGEGSEVFPATDFHVRRGENIGRNYLNDIYGALPNPKLHEVFAEFASSCKSEQSNE